MPLHIAPLAPPPPGEAPHPLAAGSAPAALAEPLTAATLGRRFHAEWDPHAPVTPPGQLVFFAQFLATSGLFTEWVRACPLRFTSPNAPTLADLLGTVLLALLAGHRRYAHVTALRADAVHPQTLGLGQTCSEDSVRRAFAGADPQACAAWRPRLICGDTGFGNECLMSDCEERRQKYLFRLRRSAGVKQLLRRLEPPAARDRAAPAAGTPGPRRRRPARAAGLGWVHHERSAALPGHGAPRGVDYNGWNLVVRCAEPERPREAALDGLSQLLRGLMEAAEPLSAAARWARMWERILRPWLRPAGLLAEPGG